MGLYLCNALFRARFQNQKNLLDLMQFFLIYSSMSYIVCAYDSRKNQLDWRRKICWNSEKYGWGYTFETECIYIIQGAAKVPVLLFFNNIIYKIVYQIKN